MLRTSSGGCLDTTRYYAKLIGTCDDEASAPRLFERTSAGMLLRSSDGRCLDAGPGVARNWRSLRMAGCRGRDTQLFSFADDGALVVAEDGRCVIEASGGLAKFYECGRKSSEQSFTLG